MIFDFGSRILRGRVVPCRVCVALTIYHHVKVMRLAFPRACCLMAARIKERFVQRGGREIVVAFYDDGFVAFSKYGVIPDGFHQTIKGLVIGFERPSNEAP